jgi:hypothetical protein
VRPAPWWLARAGVGTTADARSDRVSRTAALVRRRLLHAPLTRRAADSAHPRGAGQSKSARLRAIHSSSPLRSGVSSGKRAAQIMRSKRVKVPARQAQPLCRSHVIEESEELGDLSCPGGGRVGALQRGRCVDIGCGRVVHGGLSVRVPPDAEPLPRTCTRSVQPSRRGGAGRWGRDERRQHRRRRGKGAAAADSQLL